MVDWDAKRAKARAALTKVGVTGTVTFSSKALNRSTNAVTLDVWVLIRSREVAKQGEPAKITALLSTTSRDIENGVLACEGKRYQIETIEQTGSGTNHLMTKVVASEL